MPYSRPIQIRCESCRIAVVVEVDYLISPYTGEVYGETICPKCGEILVIDSLALRMVYFKDELPTKVSKPKKTLKRKWKIIDKGKLPKNETDT